jgi:hypothetical protein
MAALPPEDPFMCRRCRSTLFVRSQLATHEPARHSFSHRRLAKDREHGYAAGVDGAAGGEGAEGTGGAGSVGCTSWFLAEPTAWMSTAAAGDVEGKINCFKCSARVGSLNWAGAQCSCE